MPAAHVCDMNLGSSRTSCVLLFLLNSLSISHLPGHDSDDCGPLAYGLRKSKSTGMGSSVVMLMLMQKS
jgi:hypothetical protein